MTTISTLAATLLDEAGYRMIRPGVRGRSRGSSTRFQSDDQYGRSRFAIRCARFSSRIWRQLGITVNYRPLEFITLVKALDSSFDWDCVLIGFTGGIEPNDGANFLRSSGNLHLWNPSQPKPATPWEAEIDRLLEPGHDRDGPSNSVRRTTGGSSRFCTISCR